MRQAVTIAYAVAAVLALSACVAGSGESEHAAAGGMLQQLLLGLFWHGVIAPVMLIGEVINRFAPNALPWTLRLYKSRGTGVAYDVGFYFGLAGSPSIVFSRRSSRD